ncbi:hypothetical protein [Actinokineospora sp. HUAS TT18]|uniref:hypothetical protein n=1 Tax=Actinokineospora sp. HUAS TT18 TaxID=3447451 RepID=UPI003F51BF07
MKTSLFAAGAALALLALTACGQQADQAGAGPSSTTPPSSTTTAAPTTAPSSVQPTPPATTPAPGTATAPPATGVPPEFKEIPSGQVESKSLPEVYTERRVWSSPDGRTLQLIGMARDTCGVVEGVVEEFSATTVRIALRPMAQPQGGPEGQACAMVITPKPVTVALREPVGKRTVIVTAEG